MEETESQKAETPGGEPAAEAAPAAPVEAAAAPAEPVPPPAAPTVEVEAPLAPGVERLGRPEGTSKAIPETILGPRPSAVFLAVVSVVSLVSDIGSKLWAEKRLAEYPTFITIIDNHLMFVLAKNKGGAWGLLQGESENVRRPFFLLVSVAAIAFIVTLYRRLQPRQYALKWGLPLVLGGALGNVFDRIRYGYVIDFIDYRADWIKKGNELVAKYSPKHIVTDHWPTFNVADIAICVGVALMAIDMLTSRRGKVAPASRVADVPIEPELAIAGGPPLVDTTPPATDAAQLGETSAHTADGAEAPAGATDVPEAKPEEGKTITSG
ncbi:MAG: signal peptidase II [Labilithrix sp.]